MVNLQKLFKIAVITLTCILILTFIIPYDPDVITETITQGASVDIIDDVTFQEHKPIHKDSDNHQPAKSEKMFIILVTGFRTGSTFLGELFNQNPDVLYLFEPFHQNHIRSLVAQGAIRGILPSNTLLEQRTNYLQQIISDCKISYTMFGGMSTGMRCGNPAENNIRFGSVECDKSEGKWDRACKRRDMVALKLIRLQRISHLDLVPGIKGANIKVIHLIRDPRGTMNSRLGFGTFYLDDIDNLKVKPLTPEKMGIAADNLCVREWENVQFGENPPDWLKGRYMRITHDEMSLTPIESAKRVYEFIGKPIPKDLEQFLIEHTTVQHKGVLNTSKNSTEVLMKWKEKLDLPIIRAIEDKCKNLMDFMGYEPYVP